jgi:4-diphosphocytidyl-2-C-methyl-D-erythritol kinase
LTTSGLEIDSSIEENICVKAYRLLKKDFADLPPVTMHLHKVIPSGAGLGGGSSDGAFTLTLLNKKFNLGLTEDQLISYALHLGSDCAFFIKNKPCYATGRGEKLEEIELNLSNYKIVLINPGIHVHTGKAFSKITLADKSAGIKDIIQKPVEKWKEVLKNDFEETVVVEHPEIKMIKEKMYQQGAVYASMSGSGSSVYGLFERNVELQFDFPEHYFVKES